VQRNISWLLLSNCLQNVKTLVVAHISTILMFCYAQKSIDQRDDQRQTFCLSSFLYKKGKAKVVPVL